MIQESLFKSGVVGRDGFTWWIGRVAHPKYWKDTEKSSLLSQKGNLAHRCKVRIVGYHPWDATLKEDDLPWAQVLLDATTGSGQGGMGDTMALAGGETCIGFFLDGEEAQQPVIMGLLHKHREIKASIRESEIFSEESSGFQPFQVPNSNITATKVPTPETEPISKNSPTITGALKKLDNFADKAFDTITGSTVFPGGRSAAGTDGLEKDTTKSWTPPSLCGDDAIGQMVQQLQDFVTYINGLEQAANDFIDPITNKLVNMKSKIKQMSKQIAGIMKGVINNLRDGLISKVLSMFKIFSALQKKINPADFLLGPLSSKATKKILALLYCIFGNVMDKLKDFLGNMLGNLIGRTINAPLCAAEQFVSGILAKAMNLIEGLTGPILKGIDWLTGGLANISKVLSNVSALARKIFSFLDCDALKCDKPSEWVSSRNKALKKKTDSWKEALDKVDVFKGIQSKLDDVESYIGKDKLAKAIAGGDLATLEKNTVGKVSVLDIINSVKKLAGKDADKMKNGGLGSIESAISLMSLFGNYSVEFGDCNNKTNDPTSQDDIIIMPPGFKYNICIPPKAEANGVGVGAELQAKVGLDGRVFSVEVVKGGFGYDEQTSVAIIDNTNHGKGAQATPLVSAGGSITSVVITSSGYGYCGGDAVGIVTGLYPGKPGIGYTSGDTIIIEPSNPTGFDTGTYPGGGTPVGGNGEGTGTGTGTGTGGTGGTGGGTPGGGTGTGTTTITNLPVTGNGSIIGVDLPTDFSFEFTSMPRISINSNTGYGAEILPIMKDINQSRVDDSVKPLVGITSVIDCV